MTGGIGGFTTALAALPFLFRELGEALDGFAERLTSLTASSEAIGLPA
jgi:hypothetical protein